MIRILFLGDVTAKSGRDIVSSRLPSLIKEKNVDFTIVNGENAAHGKGITIKIYKALKEAGADVITLGNHAFSKHEIIDHLPDCPDLIRPMNIEPINVGNAYLIREVKGKKIAIYNLLGQAMMDVATENPFDVMDRMLDETEADIRIVDFHAETTSEKQLFFHLYRKEMNGIFGTHTHVQTADECIEEGCAYITDVGMCGPYDSIIGRDVNEVMRRTLLNEHTRFTPGEGPAVLCGILIDVDEQTCSTVHVERIQERP